jgi:transposase
MKRKQNGAQPPAALALYPRSEGERSENERSGDDAKAGPADRPNPEVMARAKRRSFTGEYKLGVLAAADAARETGDIGALLRREGLYSSHLVTWRRERQTGMLQGLTPAKRGPKSKRNPLDEEVDQLRRQNTRLTEELRKAAIIIDVQKKLATLLESLASQAPAEKRA